MQRVAAWILLLSLGLPAGPARPAPAEAPPTPRWLTGITRVAYTDLSNGHRSGDWPEKVIADFARAGVQMMFSRVHNGSDSPGLFWRSAYGDADPAMEKGRDGTREVVALCHKHGIRYLAYYWAQREPDSLADETPGAAGAHPEWRMLNSAGKPNGYFCANNAGYRDLVRNRVVELVKDVGVDGIFFDMYHAVGGACYCPACKAKFRAQTGEDPPVKEDFDSPLWQQWVEFKYRSIEDALLEYNRGIKAANPQAALVVNTWNAWVYRNSGNLRNSIRVAECVDGLLEETGWYDTVDPSFFAGPAHMNFMNWHLAGLCKGKRAFMWGAPSLPGWLSLGYEEPAIRVMTMMTNGAVPAHSVPGRDVLARLMADVGAREEYTRNARIHPWCGLVVSEKSELWYGRDDPKGRYVKGIYGAYQALLERHLPATLVTDRELERGLQDRYSVLFLPNCAAMSDAEMETVRRYVRDGGSVVATYETSLYDEHGRPRQDFGLGDLLHAKRAGAFDAQAMFASWTGRSATLSLPAGHPWSVDPVIRRTLGTRGVTQPATTTATGLPLHCRMLLVAPTNGERSPLRLSISAKEAQTGVTTAQNTVALVQSGYGKGRVIYIPFDISWSFFRYGHEYLARMMELALREAAAEPPPVEVDAPAIVEAMPQVQGDRLVVHLLNDASSTGRSQNVAGESLYVRREVIPIHGIRVTFRDRSFRRFLLVPGKKPLVPTDTPAGWQVTVPRLEMHCMVVAERAGPALRSRYAGAGAAHGTVGSTANAGRPAVASSAVSRPTGSRPAGNAGVSGSRPATVGSASSAGAPVPVPGAPNLLRNGDFEERAGDAPADWHLAQPRDGTVVLRAGTEGAAKGASCLYVCGVAGWACAEGERLPLGKGKVYLLRGFARATRGDVFLQISYWRDNRWLGMTQSGAVTTDGEWQECAVATEPTRFPEATHISISGTARGGSVEAWFDDLVLTECLPAGRR